MSFVLAWIKPLTLTLIRLVLPGSSWADEVVPARIGVLGKVLVVEHRGLVSVADSGSVSQVVPGGYRQLAGSLATMAQAASSNLPLLLKLLLLLLLLMLLLCSVEVLFFAE